MPHKCHLWQYKGYQNNSADISEIDIFGYHRSENPINLCVLFVCRRVKTLSSFPSGWQHRRKLSSNHCGNRWNHSHWKYHRGQWREGHWVFEGIERDMGRCFMLEVPDRPQATLHALILRWIRPGTHIISDSWRAYRGLNQLGGGIYDHEVIIHEQHFVDPNSQSVHTQNVENLWMRAKRKLKRQSGTSWALFSSYLWEFLWLQKYHDRRGNYSAHIMCCIREQYGWPPAMPNRF